MNQTGIVRRIDDLGRVVIPKEVRRHFRIKEGDPLEIFITEEGVLFKKYSPMANLQEFAQEYTNSLNESVGLIAIVTNNENILAVSGVYKSHFVFKPVWKEISEVIEDKKSRIVKERTLVSESKIEFQEHVIVPISSRGDIIGTVILATEKIGILIGDAELKLAETAANFLAKQMETD